MRPSARRSATLAARRLLCTDNKAASERTSTLGAYGKASTRGSGLSLMGSKSRGQGALSAEDKERLARGEIGLDGDDHVDLELEAGDVLMEVLAEDHRYRRTVEYKEDEIDIALPGGEASNEDDEEQRRLAAPRGPRLAQRQYLTHPGVGGGTAYQREQQAARLRLESAEAHAFTYRMPTEARQQREHERRSRARMREHDVIENRIQEAMATGAFDDLPGRGKPLPMNENPFEAISGDALAHRILKNAGCAPGWVEQGKAVRQNILNARANLAMGWAACGPEWPPPADGWADEERNGHHDNKVVAASPSSLSGGWKNYRQPGALGSVENNGDGESGVTTAVNGTAVDAASVAATETAEEEAKAAAEAEAAALTRIAAERGKQPAEWRAALEAFDEEMRDINKLIDSYNLAVPASWMAVHRVNVPSELSRALAEAPQRAKELKSKNGGRAAGSSIVGTVSSVSAGFALHTGTLPGLFESLRSAVTGRGY